MPLAPHHEALLEHYAEVRADLVTFGEALRVELVTWLASEPELKVHSVTMRVKTAESLTHKLARPDRSYETLWDVTDLLGLRITTYFEDAVDLVAKLLEGRQHVALEHSIDKRRRDSTVFGYRSLHYVCRFGGSPTSASFPADACFEVQVRSVLEHAWAEIEHDLGYKSQDVMPAASRRRLSRLAGLLELADQEFVAVRAELDAYARSLPARIQAEAETVALDRLSLIPLLDCREVREVDLAIAGALEKELGTEPFFPAYLVKMLTSTGIRSVLDARRGVVEHAGTILAMVKPYFAFAFRTWRLSPEPMQQILRGYSLFFLAHAVVMRTTTLRIDKVARLAHLYSELDYPDDERAAQHVAGLLVEALGDLG